MNTFNKLRTRVDRREVLTGLASAVGTAALMGAGFVVWKNREESEQPLGIDVSWPQEDIDQLPTDFPFAIVGVTGGLPTNTNEHLVEQLRWAKGATGETEQEPIQLYVNTANPGEYLPGEPNYTESINITTWPVDNIDPNGNEIYTPYGPCNNTNSLACSWQYGWNRVIEIADRRTDDSGENDSMFVQAADKAGVDIDPAAYQWWLDVDFDETGNTGNTWQRGSDEALRRNVATLEGMATCFESIGCRVGIYSTPHMWNEVVGGMVSKDSSLNGRDSWLAGAEDEGSAEDMCGTPGFTEGSTVTMVQIIPKSEGLDYNQSCVG